MIPAVMRELLSFAQRSFRVFSCLVVLVLCGTGPAQACSYAHYNPPAPISSTREGAYALCNSNVPPIANIGGYARKFLGCSRDTLVSQHHYVYQKWEILHINGSCSANSNAGLIAYFFHFYWQSECPAGTSWDETSETCVNPQGFDPNKNNQCDIRGTPSTKRVPILGVEMRAGLALPLSRFADDEKVLVGKGSWSASLMSCEVWSSTNAMEKDKVKNHLPRVNERMTSWT
ncbi:hypothetical protein [Pseudoxanthomonas wuyuanensis]